MRTEFLHETEQIGTLKWYTYIGISCLLVLFAGIMSGLTLGLMSLGLVDPQILQSSGTPSEKKQAAAILPVVQNQHQLLALPLYLDRVFNPFLAIVLSVTFVLAFGEVIPQAICTRYGLAVGANFVCLVRILMIVCYPIAYPIGKILDLVLGHNNEGLFRRAQLKALVSIHSKEACKGGELTHDETTIISDALDLTEKTAEEAMTPIESTFSLDVNSKLNWEEIGKILARGHSRVPVYSGNQKNIIGLLLVLRPEEETPVSTVPIRRIPRVPADMPLYDVLNEFQNGSSHMAAVVKPKWKQTNPPPSIDDEKLEETKAILTESRSTTLISKKRERKDRASIFSEDVEDGEVIGIIPLEDVFEELLQEEIVDETDEFVDVHKRIHVVAAAASIARTPSFRRFVGHKGAGSTNRLVLTPKTSNSCMTKPENLEEPLLARIS
ncbi:hypothetical protein MKX01_014837 [Papaver californicum]|nr:hypothetical protein MKX01_014837 [Papaver californicum]